MRFVAVLLISASAAQAGDLPDPKLTPGVADPQMTAAKLCAKGFTTKSVRNVPQSEKNKVYAEYHMVDHKGDCGLVKEGCEVDHLISLEIGGKNDIGNLWIQSYGTKPWNAHVKDLYENYLHNQVCSGKMTLPVAQKEISTDWIAGYKKAHLPE